MIPKQHRSVQLEACQLLNRLNGECLFASAFFEKCREQVEEERERQKRAHVVELWQRHRSDDLEAVETFAPSQIDEAAGVSPESSALYELQVRLVTDNELRGRYPFAEVVEEDPAADT